MTAEVHYCQTLSNARDLWVKPGWIQVEDRHPDKGGKPITEAELALIACVKRLRGWDDFCISQRGGFAWTKNYKNEDYYRYPGAYHLSFDSNEFKDAKAQPKDAA